MSRFKVIAVAVAIATLAAGGQAWAQVESDASEPVETGDLTELSLEELLEAEVTSVAKRPQRVEEAAAAVFVIGQEDIRRSGATSLPELLRMVPGMEVAGLASQNAAVSARGFNGRFANKLLVLVDGRAIYLSTLSGVLWDQQLPAVEDIQRIEIVRGPGATLWGANAVNGVINVVTKHPADTLGGAASVRASTDNDRRGYARMGVRVGEDGALRAYLVGHQYEDVALAPPQLRRDELEAAQAGFRYDVEPTRQDSFTLQADIHQGEADISRPLDPMLPFIPGVGKTDFSGANILGRWSHTDPAGMSHSLQVYWDHLERSEGGLDGRRDQIDVDFSQHFRWGGRHALVWGAGYRWSEDEVTTAPGLRFVPQLRSDSWYGAYVENEVVVVPDRLRISVGAKFEHNDFTGFEFQPSIRGIWTAQEGWSAWAAVSRAVRTPSRLETAFAVDSPFVAIAPAPDLDAEELLAWEIGWRGRLNDRVSLDATAYLQEYDNLVVWSAQPATGPGQPFLTLTFVNGGRAVTSGLEAALDVRLTERWTIKAAGSITDMELRRGGFPAPGFGNFDPGNSPRWQASVRSWFDLTDAIDVDIWVRHTDRLRTGSVDAYTDVDLRLAWRPTPTLEFMLVGENLFGDDRIEMVETGLGSPSAVVERRVWISAAVRY